MPEPFFSRFLDCSGKWQRTESFCGSENQTVFIVSYEYVKTVYSVFTKIKIISQAKLYPLDL